MNHNHNPTIPQFPQRTVTDPRHKPSRPTEQTTIAKKGPNNQSEEPLSASRGFALCCSA
ncbi:hypothetical protein BJY00DRAFT_270864 [Aspergillus carlsbadensis]|nr:hypothetical protein BJY00DRAFT_270864 [Aspergillus carlsbadensis]